MAGTFDDDSRGSTRLRPSVRDRYWAALVVSTLVLGGCDKGTEVALPGPASLHLSDTEVQLSALQDTARITAQVLDEGGSPMADTLVSWTSTDPSVVSVSQGLVTALGNGAADIVATIGSLAESVSVTVDQVAASIRIVTDADTVLVGNFMRFSADVHDAAGYEVRAPELSWTVTGTALATSGPGLLMGMNPGTATLVAEVDAIADTLTLTSTEPAATLPGDVFAPQNKSLAGLAVSLTTGDWTYRAFVSAAGSFSLGVPEEPASGTLVIDALGSGRTFLPTWIEVDSESFAAGPTVVLVPVTYTVPTGRYAGQSAPISLDDAFQAPAGDPVDWSFYRSAMAATDPLPLLLEAPRLASPIKTAFDRERYGFPIEPEDSVWVWSVLDELAEDLGIAYHRPAQITELPEPAAASDEPPSGFAISYSPELSSGGFAGFSAPNEYGFITAAYGTADVGLTCFCDARVLRHEIVHALGFGHTRMWSSVMGGSEDLTLQDVAYMRLAFEINELVRTTGARHAYAAARDGERVLMRGLPPMDPCWTTYTC